MSGSKRAYPLLLVAVGGFAGTLSRYATSRTLDDWTDWPMATMVVNIVGAFALGVLIERLAIRGPESERGRDVRLLVGTGFLGSFTTYSSFAVDAERLLADGAGATTAAYVAATLVVGLVSCVAGVLAATWWPQPGTERGQA